MLKQKQQRNEDTDLTNSELTRVRKVIGQLEGVGKMISSHRQPLQIIQQIKAASAALTALRHEILKRHLEICLADASTSSQPARLVDQILEAIKMQAVK